jgi:hypothetical protein
MFRIILTIYLLVAAQMTFGQVTWRRTYGGYAADNASAVRQLDDGGYIVLGTTGSFGAGASDMYMLRLNALGDPIWTNVYGGLGIDVGVAVMVLDDGFILTGHTSTGSVGGYDIRMLRLNAEGGVVWEVTTGTTEWDFCHSAALHGDALFVTGLTYGHGCLTGCAFVKKFDLDGNEAWTHVQDTGIASIGQGVAGMQDGGAVYCGAVSNENDHDGLIARLDAEGGLSWQQVVGGVANDHLNDVVVTGTGGIVAAGSSRSISAYERAWLVALDQTGEEEWQRDFGAGTADAAATALIERIGGGFAVTGYNTLNFGHRDMILAILDNEGWFEFGFNYGDGEPADGHAVDVADDGGYVIAGWAENYGPGIRAVYVVKTDSAVQTGSLDVTSYTDPVSVPDHSRTSFSLYPNPVASGEILYFRAEGGGQVRSITLTDLSGRVVAHERCSGCTSYAVPRLASGAYHIRLDMDGGQRMIQTVMVE